jgi:alpha-galactosidase
MKNLLYVFFLLFISVTVKGQNTANEGNYDNYILTPEPPPVPKINGARVLGVRPGNPVFFTIPATGTRPMTFSARNLPEGINLDELTGRLSGSLNNPGTYLMTLTATNESGTDVREFRIIVGEKIALTPTLGWNSWSCWGEHVTAENIRASADAMVESGLINHGFQYINIDIGWEGKRGGKYNAIQPNEKFPDMQELCDYIHSLGLKVGIYSTAWTRTFFGYPGGSSDNEDGEMEDIVYAHGFPGGRYVGKYSFVKNDVKQWAEWGMDYLKYDYRSDSTGKFVKEMSEALRNCGRDIIFYTSLPPDQFRYVQEFATAGNEIRDVWDRSTLTEDTWAFGLTDIWDLQAKWRDFVKPGNYANAGMMAIGWVGFGDKELWKSRLTPDEQYTHMSLWCLWASPIIISTPLEKLDKFTINLLSNDEVLQVNQDPLGRRAFLTFKNEVSEIWVKEMEDGSRAVGLFNRSTNEMIINVPLAQLGIYGKQRIRDLWRQKDLGIFEDIFGSKVPPHGVLLVRMYEMQ